MKIKVNNGRRRRLSAGKKSLDGIAFSEGATGPQITFRNGAITPTKRLKIRLDNQQYLIGDIISKTKYYTTVTLEAL